MDNDNLTPPELLEKAKAAISKEVQKKNALPNCDYFPISERHLQQRLITAPPARVQRYIDDYNKMHETQITLLAADIGITGTGDTDRALFTISNLLNRINIMQGDMFGAGLTSRIINYAIDLSQESEYLVTKETQEKIYISFSLAEFARIYYNESGNISGGKITRVMDVLRKLDSSYYLLYNPEKKTAVIKKYISLPQIELGYKAKNINLTLEIDPTIFAITKGAKYANIGVNYFRVYKKANHFAIQFYTFLVDIARRLNSQKSRKQTAETTITKKSIFEKCATTPKYKKNPQYKERELRTAIDYAREVGIIKEIKEITTPAGEAALNITLNLRHYLPNTPTT